MRKLLILLIFSGILIPENIVHALNLDKKLVFYFNVGESSPVGDFNRDVRGQFNFGIGTEYQFSSKWSLGATIQKLKFDHKEIKYDSWNQVWRYTDWTFYPVNLYGKLSFQRKNFSPYIKLGIAVYPTQRRRIYMENLGDKQNVSNKWDATFNILPALGCQYSVKRFFIFVEANYSLVSTAHFVNEETDVFSVFHILPALGCRYSVKRFFIFAEVNYNLVPTDTRFRVERAYYELSQFLNFILGIGVTYNL